MWTSDLRRTTLVLLVCVATTVFFSITKIEVFHGYVQQFYPAHSDNIRAFIDHTPIYMPSTNQCRPVTNIAFIKTHKTGSSTMTNILMRFGLANNLNFALPNAKLFSKGFNHLSQAGEVVNRGFVYPLPEGQEYNILMHHSVYNQTFLRELMPKNTVYITILREPFSQMMSSYEYY
ncbi:Galactose-3-O-sulfotransferase 2 [Bulinus truncatus]|nr:Galactose-3-O-sulfotransferase 2 [Bulinus truncatus]